MNAPLSMINLKHPYYPGMDTEAALSIATRLHPANGLLPSEMDVVPTLPEAIKLVSAERGACGFNWITGRVAEEVLRAANGEKNPFTT